MISFYTINNIISMTMFRPSDFSPDFSHYLFLLFFLIEIIDIIFIFWPQT